MTRLFLLMAAATLAWAGDRQEYLNQILTILPHTSSRITGRISTFDKDWESWQKRTGELPPDFDALLSQPFLPDPLDGVKTPGDWSRRRAWIRSQFEQWVFGKMPPTPGNVRATVESERQEGGVTVRDVKLEFGPDRRAVLHVQVMIPPGRGPFPAFVTNHPRTRPWVATVVRRGYIGCIYFALDPIYGHADDSDKFIEVYPDYDWSCLARWAWSASRAVDYLVTLPQVEARSIAISGHSRNGKQALLAAAFDERFGAVALSSGNTGEGTPWRYTTDMFQNESIEQISGNFPHWFHPRLRFFAGREHKLPVDQNLLMALVAPRGLLLASAFSEGQGAPFGFEQAYCSARKVYQWLRQPNRIGLSLRAGEHPTTAGDIEKYIDFFDTVFGRKTFPKQEDWILGYSFEEWQRLSGEHSAPREVTWHWLLGEEPPGLRFPAARKLSSSTQTSDGWLAGLLNRPLQIQGVKSAPLAFGDDLKGDLYLPSAAGKFPVVVYLHPFSHATGYSRYARPIIQGLTKRGFAVFCFDQIGFGTRVQHAREFYRRYPHWSLLGKMVADTQNAVDALAALDEIDSTRIYLTGWALGAKVAVIVGAADRRVRAVAAVAGIDSLRSPGKETEGLEHYWRLHGLLPRLGLVKSAPPDWDELLKRVKTLVVAPQLDRYHTNVKSLGPAALETPLDFNRFPAATQNLVFDWLAAN